MKRILLIAVLALGFGVNAQSYNFLKERAKKLICETMITNHKIESIEYGMELRERSNNTQYELYEMRIKRGKRIEADSCMEIIKNNNKEIVEKLIAKNKFLEQTEELDIKLNECFLKLKKYNIYRKTFMDKLPKKELAEMQVKVKKEIEDYNKNN